MARPKRTTSPDDSNEVRAVLSGLRRTRQREDKLEATRLDYVLRARAVGLSWLVIATELGMSVGAVHARYAGLNGTARTTHFSPATDVDVIPNLTGSKTCSKTGSKTTSKKPSKKGQK